MGSSSDVFLARAALRQHFSRIQRAIRDAYQGNSPNVMITCDEFAILAAEAVAEAASMNVHALREAAAMLFTKKLDASGSGVVSVRQVNSLLSFGYAEAAGVQSQLDASILLMHHVECGTQRGCTGIRGCSCRQGAARFRRVRRSLA